MNWMDWLVVAYFGVNAFGTIVIVNRPRKPLEPLAAAIVVLIYAALILGVLMTHGGAS